jgi:hypothetical protein
MAQTFRAFEETVRRRVLIGALNYETAMCGGFVTVADAQQWACNWRPAEPWQYANLARRFGLVVPPGYGQATEKAA